MSHKKSQECLTIFFFQGGVVKNLVPCLLLTIFFSPMRWYVFPARQWMNFSFKSPLIWQIGVLSTVGGKLAYNLGVAILVHLYGLCPHFLLKIFFDNLNFWNTLFSKIIIPKFVTNWRSLSHEHHSWGEVSTQLRDGNIDTLVWFKTLRIIVI